LPRKQSVGGAENRQHKLHPPVVEVTFEEGEETRRWSG
jgi:hypothetical protein